MWGIVIKNKNVSEFFSENEAIRAKILVEYGKTEQDIEEMTKTLRKWAKKHTKLPRESHDREFLTLMLYRNKFQVERAKKKIEAYFKTIQNCSEFFQNLNEIKLAKETGTAIPSKHLTPNGERLGIFKLKNPKTCRLEDVDFSKFIRIAAAVGSISFHSDYNLGNRYILDFEGCTFRMILKATPFLLLKLVQILQNLLSVKINGIELINVPGFVTYIMRLAKMVTPAKLFAKIRVHENLESLYKLIPRESLPRDYGGDAPSVDEGIEFVDSMLEAHKELFEKLSELSRK